MSILIRAPQNNHHLLFTFLPWNWNIRNTNTFHWPCNRISKTLAWKKFFKSVFEQTEIARTNQCWFHHRFIKIINLLHLILLAVKWPYPHLIQVIFFPAQPGCTWHTMNLNNLQGHSSLTPVYLYISNMTFGVLNATNSSPQVDASYITTYR